MARRTSEPGTGRIAVLGAASPAGTHLRAALADRGVPGARVELFGHQREVAVLSEYDGEARLVQAPEELEAASYDAVFVCELGHEAGDLTAAASQGTAVIDMTGSIPGAALAGEPGSKDTRLVAIPHPLTAMLVALLAPVSRSIGLTRVSAFVLRPASDFGEPGLEELREQTVHLLRFEPTPTEIFGRQLAFNVVPEPLFPTGENRTGARVVRETRALLGAPELPVALSQALVPTFFGHGIAAHIELRHPAREEALAAWAKAPGVAIASDPEVGATLDAPEAEGLLIARVDEDGGSTLSVWALGSEAGPAAAAAAIAAGAEAGVL